MSTQTDKYRGNAVDPAVRPEGVARDQLVVSTPLTARPPVASPHGASPYGGPLSGVSADLGDHW